MVNNTIAGGILIFTIGLITAIITLYYTFITLKSVSSIKSYWKSLSGPIDALEYCNVGSSVLTQ